MKNKYFLEAIIGSVVTGLGLYIFGDGVQKDALHAGATIGYNQGYIDGCADSTKKDEEVSSNEETVD